MLAMKLSEKLKRICGERGWGQSNLLGFVPDVTKSTMSNWYQGKYKPDLESALRLARGLNVPLDWLADDEADYPPPSDSVPSDERYLLQVIRDLNLSRDEAVRRLAGIRADGKVEGSGSRSA